MKTSSNLFHESFPETMRKLVYCSSKDDQDLWIKDIKDHYSWDGLLICGKEPNAVLEYLIRLYILKGVSVIQYYLGVNVQCVKYAYPDVKLTQDQCTSDFSAQTYIGRLKERAD